MATDNSARGGYDQLLPQHRALLDDSAISETVARARGYWSAEKPGDLNGRFAGEQKKRVPGLVIPVLDVTGKEAFCQLRPDAPREKNGKVLKYETPAKARMVLDVPPATRPHLDDPNVALWITEGVRKVDALITAGFTAIGLLGVWNWRGKNEKGGKKALSDWHDVALNDRRVVLCFDSDSLQNADIHYAVGELGRYLEGHDARLRFVYLPSNGDKVGVDDFLAAGHGRDDLVSLIEDRWRPLAGDANGRGGCGSSERRAQVHKAPRLAYEANILDRLITTLHALGHVGEERACKLVYLSATSRLLAQIVSLVAKGPSAAGKSATIDRVLELFPDEAFVRLSGMSERFLVYDDRPIKHRMLILHEAAGMSGEYATYLIRTLLSEGRLVHGTVESTPEGPKPLLIEREGPAGLITSTTQVNLHAENETRLLSIPIDDTREQTKRVMAAIARGATRAPDLSEWHRLQLWLADGECRVDVPFAAELAEKIPPIAVRLRRDFGAVLGLVRAHALLHRASRLVDGEGRVLATVDDYAAVRELVHELVSEGIGAQVSQATRETVAAVAGEGGDHVSSATLAIRLKLDRSAVNRRINKAIAQGYLINDEERPKKPMRIRIGDPLPEQQEILPPPDALCTCASDSAGGHPPNNTDGPAEPSAGNPGPGMACEKHPSESMWRLSPNAIWICGKCHPPAQSTNVEWGSPR